MNTYLLDNTDGDILHSTKSAIIEKSNNIEDIQFVVEREYGDFDLSTFDFVMQWVSPISKETHIATLTMTDDAYKTSYVLFTLPVTAKAITAESGDIAFTISAMKTDMSESGDVTKYVKNYGEGTITIVPMANWITFSDSALSSLAELYTANQQQIAALNAYATAIYSKKADDIELDTNANKIILTSNGTALGDGISLSTLNAELVEAGSSSSGNVNIVDI